jgi:ribosome-binding protein aMBF1 (putative translation factor)
MNESIKISRQKAGMTQVDVEKSLSLRNLSIRDYESGRLKLPVSIAIELSKLYKITLNELLNVEVPVNNDQQKSLAKFKGLFLKNRAQLILLDPIVRGYLESHYEHLATKSLFEILVLEQKESSKIKINEEFGKIFCSLAGIDLKVTNEEVESLNLIFSELGLESSLKNIKKYLKEPYYVRDSSIKTNELKHFLVWCLFIFAESDGEIAEEESLYIEQVAESLKINRTNFLFIKSKFIEEEF